MPSNPDATQPPDEGRPWQTHFARWLSPEGYLGLHLIVGFAVVLATGILFTFIVREVFTADATLAADAWAQAVAQSMRSAWMTDLMRFASWVGAAWTLTVLSVGVGLLLYVRGSHRRLYAFAATMGGGSLLNVLLKLYYQRARPSDFPPLDVAHGFSFPSGHSMGSMLFFGSLAYVLYFSLEGDTRRRFGLPAVVLCALVTVVVGFSRIYLGVHFLSDVIAGFSGGLFWIGVCISGTEAWVRWRDWRRNRRNRIGPGSDEGGSRDRRSPDQ